MKTELVNKIYEELDNGNLALEATLKMIRKNMLHMCPPELDYKRTIEMINEETADRGERYKCNRVDQWWKGRFTECKSNIKSAITHLDNASYAVQAPGVIGELEDIYKDFEVFRKIKSSPLSMG